MLYLHASVPDRRGQPWALCRHAGMLCYLGAPAWCWFMPVSVVDMSLCLELGSWGQKMQRKGKVLDCWQFLRCNARNSFQPQCVGRQGRCFHCRCSERRRLFKILKFDFSTLFCLRFPRFLRGTLVDEPPVKDWCLPGTVCHQSHPQSSGLASGWQGNIGKPPWHWSRTPGFCTCRILDLGCSQTLQPVLPR